LVLNLTPSSRHVEYTAVELDGSVHVVTGHFEVGDEFAASPHADDQAFRAAMSVLAAGVVMVTTWQDGRPWGLTISACCSVTVDPPEIMISVRSTTVSCRTLLEDRRFGVSILSAAQKPLAEFGSAVGAAKFVDDYCDDLNELESPMIADALCHLDCAVSLHQNVGDHTLVVGRVLHVVHPQATPENPEPLLYFNRNFWNLGRAT